MDESAIYRAALMNYESIDEVCLLHFLTKRDEFPNYRAALMNDEIVDEDYLMRPRRRGFWKSFVYGSCDEEPLRGWGWRWWGWNFDKYSLHRACQYGDLKLAKQLIRQDEGSCFKKNRYGMTPLHIAAKNGHVEVVDLILKYCPESVKEVTKTTKETCLHVAVKHNQIEVVLHLLKWIIRERPDFLPVLNFKDRDGKTAVQSSVSRKPFQTIRVSVPLNSDGSVALDISYDLPWFLHHLYMTSRYLIKQKIKHSDDHSHIGLSNGSCDLAKQIIHRDHYSHRGLSNSSGDVTIQIMEHSDDYSHRGLSKSSGDLTIQKLGDDYSHRGSSKSSGDSIIPIFKHSDDCSPGGWPYVSSDTSTVKSMVRFRSGLLLIATLIATIAFQVPFHLLGSTSKEGYKQDSIMFSSLILLNSTVFISSVGVIIFVLHDFPLKPWPHISILALYGSYMFSLKVIIPDGAPVLFFVSFPILLVCICGKPLWLCKPKSVLSTSSVVASG